MIFILGDKKYDTETATEIVHYVELYTTTLMIGNYNLRGRRSKTLYKTQKGNWFSICKKDRNEFEASQETEQSARKILKELNEADLYIENFGELEEA